MVGGLDAGKYFWRSGREKCFSLDIPFYRTSGSATPHPSNTSGSLRGEEAENLAHHAVCLIGLEEKLSVGGAVEND